MFGGKLSGCSKFWCIHKIRSRNVLITLCAYVYQKTHKPLFEQKQIEDHDYQNKRKHLIPRETKEVWCAKAITVTSHDHHGVLITGNTTVSERLVQPYQKESIQALLGHHAVSPEGPVIRNAFLLYDVIMCPGTFRPMHRGKNQFARHRWLQTNWRWYNSLQRSY